MQGPVFRGIEDRRNLESDGGEAEKASNSLMQTLVFCGLFFSTVCCSEKRPSCQFSYPILDLQGSFVYQLSLSTHGLFAKMWVHAEPRNYVQKHQLHLAVEDRNYVLCCAAFCLLGKFKLASSQIFPANLNLSLPRDGNRKNDYYMSSLMFLHQHGHREQSCVKVFTFFVCEAPAVPLNVLVFSVPQTKIFSPQYDAHNYVHFMTTH